MAQRTLPLGPSWEVYLIVLSRTGAKQTNVDEAQCLEQTVALHNENGIF